jgi:hypothetical protein
MVDLANKRVHLSSSHNQLIEARGDPPRNMKRVTSMQANVNSSSLITKNSYIAEETEFPDAQPGKNDRIDYLNLAEFGGRQRRENFNNNYGEKTPSNANIEEALEEQNLDESSHLDAALTSPQYDNQNVLKESPAEARSRTRQLSNSLKESGSRVGTDYGNYSNTHYGGKNERLEGVKKSFKDINYVGAENGQLGHVQTPIMFPSTEAREIESEARDTELMDKSTPFVVSNWDKGQHPAGNPGSRSLSGQINRNNQKTTDRDTNTFTFNRPGESDPYFSDSRNREISERQEGHLKRSGLDHPRGEKFGDPESSRLGRSHISETRKLREMRDLREVSAYESNSIYGQTAYHGERQSQAHGHCDLPPKRRSFDTRNDSLINSIQDTSNLTLKSGNQTPNVPRLQESSPTKNLSKMHYHNNMPYQNHHQRDHFRNSSYANDSGLHYRENSGSYQQHTRERELSKYIQEGDNNPDLNNINMNRDSRATLASTLSRNRESVRPGKKSLSMQKRNYTPVNKPSKNLTPKKNSSKAFPSTVTNSSKGKNNRLTKKPSFEPIGPTSNKKRAVHFNGSPNERIGKMMLEYIEIGKKVESAKQELALRPDYNIKDHFRCIDRNLKGSINFNEFLAFFKGLKITGERTKQIS